MANSYLGGTGRHMGVGNMSNKVAMRLAMPQLQRSCTLIQVDWRPTVLLRLLFKSPTLQSWGFICTWDTITQADLIGLQNSDSENIFQLSFPNQAAYWGEKQREIKVVHHRTVIFLDN